MSLEVAELAPGLWRWTARHPEWTPDEDWPADVGAVYWEGEDATCLVDPIVPRGHDDERRFFHHLDADVERRGRPVSVLLTVSWHERDAGRVAQRYEAEVWAPEPALARLSTPARGYRAGEQLPGGLEAIDVARSGEVVYLVPSEPPALVAGDVLLADGAGVRLCPDDWFDDPDGAAQAREALRPLLERLFGLLVVSHGEPVMRDAGDALRAALDG